MNTLMSFVIPFAMVVNIASAGVDAVKSALNLKVVDGQLIAPTGLSKKFMVEDCRQVAINQTILDVSAQGMLPQFSRSKSHKFNTNADGSQVMAIAGVRVYDNVTANAKADPHSEKSLVYRLADAVNGPCDLVPGKKEVDQHLARTSLPAYLAQEFPGVQIVGEEGDKPGEEVDRMIKRECTQQTINRALAATAREFKAKFGTLPVMYIDMQASKQVLCALHKKNKPEKKCPVTTAPADHKSWNIIGNWEVLAASKDGQSVMKASFAYDVKDFKTPERICKENSPAKLTIK